MLPGCNRAQTDLSGSLDLECQARQSCSKGHNGDCRDGGMNRLSLTVQSWLPI